MSRYKDTCPKCGGEKDKTAEQCRDCYAFLQDHSRFYAVRQVRGDWPQLPASPQLDLSEIGRDWLMTFVGIFMADGYISTTKCRGRTVGVIASMNLRADDKPLLDVIASKLGGKVYRREVKRGHPIVCWNIGGLQRMRLFCQLLLGCPLPAKKLRDVRAVLDFIEWRLTKGFRLTDEEKREALRYHERVKSMRIFKEPNG